MSDLRTCPVCGQTKESSKFYKNREECRACIKAGNTLESMELPQVEESALETLKKPSTGLGDVVEKITTVTGIKAVVEAVVGDDCGCDERKEKLNRLLPFKTRECMTDNELEFVGNYVENFNGSRLLAVGDALEIHRIWTRVFGKKFNKDMCTHCNKSLLVSRLNDLMNIYNNY